MFFWNQYPFVRFSAALIVGILLYNYLPLIWNTNQIAIPALLALFVSTVMCSGWLGYYKLRFLNGTVGVIALAFLGGFLVQRKYDQFSDSHYKNFEAYKVEGFTGSIVSPPNERTNYFRYDLLLHTALADSQPQTCTGKIHLYVKKDSLDTMLSYGDRIAVSHNFYEVPPPKNPNEFDYKDYLSKKGIYSQSFVTSDQVKKISENKLNLILYYAFEVRATASKIIDTIILEEDENGIAKALLLGIREGLSNEIKDSYSAAGAMHVLAVSGLHVGIVYLLLKTLLSFLKGTLRGRQTIAALSVATIWFYAMITGLSPSVLRAATMFSIVAIGEINTTKGNVYNNLGFSAFLLLLLDPYLIYSVGFQLSYAAVFGIVYLQPLIYRSWAAPNWFLDKVWSITCVSIAAQLATFPLVAHYFHQFPTYFLVSNLIVIPAASVMLTTGLLMIMVHPISTKLSFFIGNLLEWIISMVNEAMIWVETLPYSLITWLYLDLPSTLLVYASTICFLAAIQYRSFKTVVLCFLMLTILTGWNFSKRIQRHKSNQIVFYEIKEKIAIDHWVGTNCTLYLSDFKEEEFELLAYQINPNRLAEGLGSIENSIERLGDAESFSVTDSNLTLGVLGDHKLMILYSLDDLSSYQKPIQTDFLLLELNKGWTYKQVFEKIHFKHLILGNTTSYWLSKKVINEAEKRGVQVHSLKKDGAFIWHYD